MDDRYRRIEQRAYEIWEREGRPEGRHAEHWRDATSEIEQEERERAATSRDQSTQPPPTQPRSTQPHGGDPARARQTQGETGTAADAAPRRQGGRRKNG